MAVFSGNDWRGPIMDNHLAALASNFIKKVWANGGLQKLKQQKMIFDKSGTNRKRK
jgi:hypothetical protein